jgi:hypothetical protein
MNRLCSALGTITLARFAFLFFLVMAHSYGQTANTGKRMFIYDDRRAVTTALSLIESGGDDNAVGDRRNPDGPALGRFQIHQSAWDDISAMRAKDGRQVWPYHSARNELIAEDYAYTLLTRITNEFKQHYVYEPSPIVLYSCYSLGPSIVPKIKSMRYLELVLLPNDRPMVCPYETKPYAFLTGIGYSTALAKRKVESGMRFSALLAHHKFSIETTNKPTLYK